MRLILFFFAAVRCFYAEEPAKFVDLPPAPKVPKLQGMTEDEISSAYGRWEAQSEVWRQNLTAAQKQELTRLDAARDRIPLPTDGYDWRVAASAQGLAPAEVEQLEKNKLLISTQQMQQNFQVYVHPKLPTFITSDSLLNTFHVLFEDTFRELEIRRAPQLRKNLESVVSHVRLLLKSPPYPVSDLQPGWLHAQRVLGPAMCLLGTPLEFFDAEVRDDITAQMRKIREATAVELPGWLGPPDDSLLALDYRRCKPVGFYADNERLADYFRAVRWLQTVPLRPERDTELTAAILLAYGFHKAGDTQDFFKDYENFLGQPADRTLFDWDFGSDLEKKSSVDWASVLREDRKWLAQTSGDSSGFGAVNDSLRTRPDNEKQLYQSFRVLSAFRLPDAALFQFLTGHDEPVSGLDVAALVGSPWAEKLLAPDHFTILASGLKQAQQLAGLDKEMIEDASLYNEYLGVLQALFTPPDADAPAFMQNEAWAAKSCQTALAGWVQMRHTFTLQAKMAMVAMSANQLPPGFIEPNPLFLRRFAEFLTHTQAKLKACGVFTESPQSFAATLLDRADFLDKRRAKIVTSKSDATSPHIADSEDMQYESLIGEAIEWFEPGPTWDAAQDKINKLNDAKNRAEFAEALRNFSSFLRSEAARYENGASLPPMERHDWTSLDHRWSDLQQTVSRLETLLQKQLRRRPWSDEEAKFIEDYGLTIANIMGYFGNEPVPRDDAPRWVEVVRDPKEDDSLAVGTGRPQVLYVLYPWNGMEILTEGAVMPYFEYRAKTILTDDEWRQKLDSAEAPQEPVWIQEITEK